MAVMSIVRSSSSASGGVSTRKQKDQKFIATAMDRFRLAAEAESDIRAKALEDFKFVAGDQWDAAVAQQRSTDGRPCLTMNRLRQFRRFVTNEQRQQRPAIQIDPVGDGADQETAEVLSGVVRHIENISDAEIAYDTGFEHMATGGFGFWRIVTEFIDDTDDQEIIIKRVRNAFTVYFDPRSQEPNYADAMFCFVIEDVPKEIYEEEFEGSEMASMLHLTSVGDTPVGWLMEDTVRIAEYFYVELEPSPYKGRPPARKVKWAKINAVETLDGPRKVAGKWIPVIPVLGDDQMIDGKRDLVGLIRDAKDPQRMYNYQISAAAETIALAPKSPNVIAEGQIENHETEWEASNRRNTAVLTYKPISVGGQPVPPPQRNTAEPPIMAMAAMIRQADNDLKATTGIYDASLGQQGPEQSGKAVMLRQKQSDIANLNYMDNMARAIRHTGRVILAMIPEVYDAKRVQRIVKPDGSVDIVGVFNSQNEDRPDPDELEDIQKIYDIGTGRYDVTVSVGPSYQSKRQEAVASQIALISSFPQIMGVAGDLLVRNMDWPGAKEIADRLKLMLPPALQEDQSNPAAMQQKMQQMEQQLQAMTAALQHSQQIISGKLIESQSKTNIALIDQETKLNVARITASKDADTAQADRETEMLQTMMGQAHEAGQQAADHAHEAGMQSADQSHEMTMSQMPPPQGAPPETGGAPPAPDQAT